MSKQKISTKAVKGMRDFYPEDMRIRNWLFSTWRRISEQFGYEEYDACILESEELYIRKAGDEITEQLYNFADKGKRKVALRPELTPSFARMLLAKGNSLPMPLRWHSIPQCFRYEKMQKGRKREHYQWNMDIVGLQGGAAEAELMAAQIAFLKAVGLCGDDTQSDVVIRVSNRLVLESMLQDLGVSGEEFASVCIAIDKRDKIGNEATHTLLLEKGISDEIAQKVLSLLDIRGLDDLQSAVGPENPGFQALSELFSLAEASGFAKVLQVDLSVVRGLSYYTGTVWELFDTQGAVPRAIAGGGRYDRLMETLGGSPTPIVGFGFGDVVIALILEERNLLPPAEARVDALVYPMSADLFPTANRIAASLRAKGQRVLVDYTERRFKNILKVADQAGCAHLYILGSEEVERGVVKVRNLSDRSEAEQALSSFD